MTKQSIIETGGADEAAAKRDRLADKLATNLSAGFDLAGPLEGVIGLIEDGFTRFVAARAGVPLDQVRATVSINGGAELLDLVVEAERKARVAAEAAEAAAGERVDASVEVPPAELGAVGQ